MPSFHEIQVFADSCIVNTDCSFNGGCNNNNSDDCDAQILRHRNVLVHKPKNALAMAQLACLLFSKAASKERCQSDSNLQVPSDILLLKDESMRWVDLSITTAPCKPFGYAALSIVHGDFEKRMDALYTAVDKCSNKERFHVAALGLLVRLLVEPRERRRQEHKSYPLCKSNVISEKEESIVVQIENLLSKIWTSSTVIDSSCRREFVAMREYRLGRFFRKLEPKETSRARSISFFKASIQHLPTQHGYIPLAQFWLATLGQGYSGIIHQCPAEYIIDLYSTFAPRFDNLLVNKLEYQTPTILRQLHDQALPAQKHHRCPHRRGRYHNIADLGCGTGLSGLAFSSLLLFENDIKVGQMTGVDLSTEMLTLAERRGCYSKLVAGDIQNILTQSHMWDLVIACDVFCYIGDLANIFSLIWRSLLEDGIFLFSTERLDDQFRANYQLHECARFAHNTAYIEYLAKEHGFQVVAKRISPIRKNKGKDVMGYLVILRKKKITT